MAVHYSGEWRSRGIWLAFTDGDYSTLGWRGQWYDSDGQASNLDGITGQWHQRTLDMTQFQGETLNRVLALDERNGAVGPFDFYFADVALRRADGTVIPLWTGTPAPGTLGATVFGPGQATASTDGALPPGIDSTQATTHYYLADHLGTTQIELSGGGWPIWQGHFAPFGQELDASPTSMRYKFTGKERDTESGLDYFGARYYGSSMGRWMSPDWSASPVGIPYGDVENPQSFNLYSYVLNNPLKNRDPDGHSCDPDTWNSQTNTLTAGACHLDWWDLPGHAFVGLGNLMMARNGRQAAKGAGQMLYAYSVGVPLAGVGVGMSAAGGLTTMGLEVGAPVATGMVQGLFGTVSVEALQAAASSGGETISVVTNLGSAPIAGQGLSVATGEGATALAGQASGSTQFVAQIPKALVDLMEQTGLATRSYTAMGNVTAQEIRFAPQATQFVIQFFK